MTVEAVFAFPVFFFAVFYLLQMFTVLRAELVIAEAAIASARDTAAFAYAEERLMDGENVAVEKIFEIFDKKLVRDAAFTTVFYGRCDSELLENAGVAQKLGGMWVDTQKDGDAVRLRVHYRVNPLNPVIPSRQVYYRMNLVYRDWIGTGEIAVQGAENQENEKSQVVYLADSATVYHVKKDCTYINIKINAVMANRISGERNASGAKYYACEFCEPVLTENRMLYITKHGRRYHAVSTCSRLERNPRECALEEAQKTLRACKKCSVEQAKEEEK